MIIETVFKRISSIELPNLESGLGEVLSMSEKSLEEEKRKLVEAYQTLYEEGATTEYTFMYIEKTLDKFPELISIFEEMFEAETNKDRKETIAQILISVTPNQDAITFLKDEMGWDDFSGFKGFDQSNNTH